MATKLTRWDPFDDLANLWPRSLFGRDLRTFLRLGGEVAVEWSPSCSVTQDNDVIVVHAELPGVAAEDIDVHVEGSSLVVRGEKREEKKEEKEGQTYSERFFGSFERRIPIPEDTDPAKVEAKLSGGVLEVRVPVTAAPKAEPKKIEVKVG